MVFNELQIQIFNLLKPYNVKIDEIPLNFDFTKEIGAYFTIDGVSDGEYNQDYPLEVTLVGIKNIKMDIQSMAVEIDKSILDHKEIRIYRQNAFINTLIDEENKFNLIMKYWIRVI